MSSRKGKSNKRKNFLAEDYKESWNYIKRLKKFIFIIMGIFFAFAIVGFFVPPPSSISGYLIDYLDKIVKQTSGLSSVGLISFIFFNNLKSSLFGFVFGILLGIFPIISSIFNGYILGFVSEMSVKNNGALILWRLLPHGIFELPAVFISFGMGLKLGAVFVKDRPLLKKNFITASKVFILVVVPLLIIAAIIEGSFIFLIPH